MKKYQVNYAGGESRTNPGMGIDFMLVVVPGDGDAVELYAEMENPTWNEDTESFDDEAATYDDLKQAILNQAEQNGISPEQLVFQNDAGYADAIFFVRA